MDRQSVLSKAKTVLLHPNFNKLNPLQIQQVFQSILASGVTKDDIARIVLERETQPQNYDRSKLNYLEKLPRDVFKHMVQIGEISGMDLVNLCNSSTKLRTYCLTDKTDVNGKLLKKQEIYSLALEKMGIKVLSNDDPNLLYRKVASGFQLSIWNIVDKKLTINKYINDIIKICYVNGISRTWAYFLTSTGNVLGLSNVINPEVLSQANIKDMFVTQIVSGTINFVNVIGVLDKFQNLKFFIEEPVIEANIMKYFYLEVTDLKGLNKVKNIKRIMSDVGSYFAIQTTDDTVYYYLFYAKGNTLEFSLSHIMKNVKALGFGEDYVVYADNTNRIFQLKKSESIEIPNTMGIITKVVCHGQRIFFSTADGNIFMMSTESSETVEPYIAKNIGFFEDLNDFTVNEVFGGVVIGRYAQISVVTKRKLVIFSVVVSLVWDYGEITGGEKIIPIDNPLFVTPGKGDVFILSIPK